MFYHIDAITNIQGRVKILVYNKYIRASALIGIKHTQVLRVRRCDASRPESLYIRNCGTAVLCYNEQPIIIIFCMKQACVI